MYSIYLKTGYCVHLFKDGVNKLGAPSPQVNKFYTGALNICGPSIRNVFYATNLAPTDSEVASRFLENLCTLDLRTLPKIRHDPYGWREVTRGKAVVTH